VTITHTIVTLTPDQASAILANGAPNRKVSKTAVAQYASDMQHGRWSYNGQDIILDSQGRLIDGQHRLFAIIKSGVDVEVGIKTGVEPEAFDTIDSGRTRSGADILSIHDVKRPTVAAAVARIGWQLDTCGSLLVYPSRTATTEYFMMWRSAIEASVQCARGLTDRRRVIPASAIGAVCFMATRHGAYSLYDFEEFAVPVMNGENCAKGAPSFALREWAIAQRIRNRGKLDINAALWATIRAWQKYTEGKSLPSIKAPGTLAGYADNFIPGQDGRIA
jgi:hypothetical protein